MALKMFLIFVTVLAYVEFLGASPTRRQYLAITEATASDMPVTNDGAVWDDNDEFDLDGAGWFSRSAVSSSPVPEKTQDTIEFAEDYSRGNAMADFGEDDEEEGEEEDEEDEDHHEQEAEELDQEDEDENDSEFLFSPPKDTRLMLEDDDDEQSGPIKVRHTGRNSYSHVSEGSDNSLESSDEEDEEHPDDFAIDEDDKQDDEDDDAREDDSSVEVVPRREPLEDDEDEDEFVSEGDENDDMFDNAEEEAAQVIYGDHVFLY